MNINILTYNIHGLPWSFTRLRSILVWCSYQATTDVICLQEVFAKHHRKTIQDFCKTTQIWNCFFPNETDNSHWLANISSSFYSGSGLCILVKKEIETVGKSLFYQFRSSDGIDTFVKKGVFGVQLKINGNIFNILTTHLQSDITEMYCYRINYINSRKRQENEIYRYCCLKDKSLEINPIISSKSTTPYILIGDLNTSDFTYYHCIDSEQHVTYPSTGEHLDHALIPNEHKKYFKRIAVKYYDDIDFSDHIPILYTIEVKC